MSTSSKNKNKSDRKILNKSGPKIDPWGTPARISRTINIAYTNSLFPISKIT